MQNKTVETLVRVLTPMFPENARVQAHPGGDPVRISVSWKLGSDLERPNKRSRRILMLLSEEVLEDYADGDQQQRYEIEKRISQAAARHLKTFDPEHSTPRGCPEPEVTWVLA